MHQRKFEGLQELLRHLECTERLRCNVLVSHLFHSADAESTACKIRAAVRAAIAALSERRHNGKDRELAERFRAIVTLCDLDGRPHDEVAEILSLSERQFYRARHGALERLQPLVKAEIGRLRPPVLSPPSEAEVALSFSAIFCDYGLFDRAIALLTQARSHCISPSLELALSTELAIVALARNDDPAPPVGVLQHALDAIAPALGDRHAEHIAVRASLALAQMEIESGDLTRAEQRLVLVAPLLERPEAASRDRLMHAYLYGRMRRCSGDTMRALHLYAECFKQSRRFGLPLLGSKIAREIASLRSESASGEAHSWEHVATILAESGSALPREGLALDADAAGRKGEEYVDRVSSATG
jgi:hypothetical protein